jgi:hypothetical protein
MDRPQQSSASSANNNRQRRRYNHKRNSSNFATTTALLKVVVRNWKTLEEMEVKMAEIYSEGTFGMHFAFDEADWSARIQAERHALKAASDWKNQQLAETANAPEDPDLEESTKTETKSVFQGTETTASPVATFDSASSVKKSSVNSTGAQISVRTLYVIPPKETSRRGKRYGLAYFVWTVLEPSNNEHKDRATLYHALESLQATINPALETQESGSMIRIQEAVNGKAWKEPTSFPNEVGSVFQTEHYRQFIQRTQDRVEERMSRPKPSPGGGALPLLNPSTNLATASTAVNSTNEPVAALVQYLNQKHEEEKKRKNLRRKEKKKKDEIVPSTNGSSSPKPTSSKTEANGSAAIKKRSRRQRRKKNGKP